MATASGVSTKKSMKFEDLVAWQRARQMTKEIYLATSKNAFSRDFGLKDQIRRAAVSTMSNLAEGFDRDGRSEFHQFLVIAKDLARRSDLSFMLPMMLVMFRIWNSIAYSR